MVSTENIPLVSIVCTVYNKEQWIAQAIESFLSQKTDFRFEILLIDDSSTDDSARILSDYEKRHPDIISCFYNEHNQGIAKTWVKICQYAKGNYIARCDGDDFWIDPYKLQKQVEILRNNPHSKWCNSDFDIYNQDGLLVDRDGFKKEIIPFADTFEKMLATRGFTMSSTWLVERELMLEVNNELDLRTSDDTFNLQLDLFKRTELIYLPESTVAYRINQGSDSRPKDFKVLQYRFNRLLETQLEYLDKYPNSNYKKIAQILLGRNNQYELELSKLSHTASQFDFEQVTIYFQDIDGQFNQENILQTSLKIKDEIDFVIPSQVSMIRVDLSEIPSFYYYVRLVDVENGQEIPSVCSNGRHIGHSYCFSQKDPQIFYKIKNNKRHYRLEYQMMNIDHLEKEDYVGNILGEKLLEVEHLQRQLQEITRQYHSVIHSRRWIIATKLVNMLRRRKYNE